MMKHAEPSLLQKKSETSKLIKQGDSLEEVRWLPTETVSDLAPSNGRFDQHTRHPARHKPHHMIRPPLPQRVFGRG